MVSCLLVIVALTGTQAAPASLDSEASAAHVDNPVEVEAGFSYEWLSNSIADWHSEFLEVSKVFGRRSALYGVLRQSRRFDLTDQEVVSGLSLPLHERWTTVYELSFSPTHRISPGWSALVGVQYNFLEGWNYGIDLRMGNYEHTSVTRFIQSVERYWGNFRGAYSLSLNTLWGAETVNSHQVAFNYYYAAKSSFGINYAMGLELERFGPVDIVSNHVIALSLLGRHWFVPGWALSYEWGWGDVMNHYSRTGVRLGLRHEL